MNVLVLFISTVLFINEAVADVQTNNKIEQLILQKCKRYSENAGTYDTVKNYFEDFSSYMRVAFSHIPDGKQQFCEEDRTRLIQLMKTLVKTIKECLPPEEKYLSKFAYESFAEFLNFLCVNDGKNIKNFFSSLGNECRVNLNQTESGQEVKHCFSKVVAPLDGKVEKQKLCDDLSIAKKCFSTTITKHCPDFPAFETLNNQFFEAIQKPCNGAFTLGGNCLLLIAVAFITSKLSIIS